MSTLTGHREESLRVELLSLADETLGEFELADPDLRLTHSLYTAVRSAGTLSFTDDGSVDWLTTRLRFTYLNGADEHPRGVYIPATPTGPRSSVGNARAVEFYDKTLVLLEDVVEETYVVEAGANVVDTVLGIVAGANAGAVDVVPSSETVAAHTAWEAGTTRLRVVNDLLDSINYTHLHALPIGTLYAAPLVPFSQRAVAWTFTDGEYEGLYLDDFEDEQDLFGVPNKWVGISRSDGDNPALVSVQTNEDPNSPFSFQRRGRWITRVTEDVEATSQEVLDSIIQGQLTDATSASRTFNVTHPWLPLALDDVVIFKNTEHGINSRCRLIKAEEQLTLPGALVTSTLRELEAL